MNGFNANPNDNMNPTTNVNNFPTAGNEDGGIGFGDREREMVDTHFQLLSLNRPRQSLSAGAGGPIRSSHNIRSRDGNVVPGGAWQTHPMVAQNNQLPLETPPMVAPNYGLPPLNGQLRGLSSSSFESSGNNAFRNNNVAGLRNVQTGISRSAALLGSSLTNRSSPMVDDYVPTTIRGKSTIVPKEFPSTREFMEFAFENDPWLQKTRPGGSHKNSVDRKIQCLDDYVIPTKDTNSGSSSNIQQTQDSAPHAALQALTEVLEVESPFKEDHQHTTPQLQQDGMMLSQNNDILSQPADALDIEATPPPQPPPPPPPTPMSLPLVVRRTSPPPPPTPISQPELDNSNFMFERVEGMKCVFCFRMMPFVWDDKPCGHYYHEVCLNNDRDWAEVLQCVWCGPLLEGRMDRWCRFCSGKLAGTSGMKPCGHYFHFACFMEAEDSTSISNCGYCVRSD